jgi:glycine cleavage system H protein
MDPQNLRYTKEHEWIRVEGERGTIGITDHAQKALGDVVFLELPAVGRELKRNEVFGTVESVKAVSELFAPVSGRVLEINAAAVEKPETLNIEPYGAGWLLVVSLADVAELGDLLDASAYAAYVASEAK